MDTIDKVILLIEDDLQKRYAHLLDVYDGIISFELCDSEITELAHFFTQIEYVYDVIVVKDENLRLDADIVFLIVSVPLIHTLQQR